MTDAPGYRETTTEQRNEWLSRLGIISTHGKFEMLCRDLDRAESELAEATARAEKAEAERVILANRLACIQSQADLDPKMRDWSTHQYLAWAAQEAIKQGEEEKR